MLFDNYMTLYDTIIVAIHECAMDMNGAEVALSFNRQSFISVREAISLAIKTYGGKFESCLSQLSGMSNRIVISKSKSDLLFKISDTEYPLGITSAFVFSIYATYQDNGDYFSDEDTMVLRDQLALRSKLKIGIYNIGESNVT